MVKPQVRMLSSVVSHLPLLSVWRESGVTRKHGFELVVHVARIQVEGQPFIDIKSRAEKLLAGEYDFLSGLHHETYVYRARGDKRFVYLAQAQNDWDDRVVAAPGINTARDLEGKKFMITSTAPCSFGNLKHGLQLGGADLSRIEFVRMPEELGAENDDEAVEAVTRGDAAATMVDMPFDLRGEKRGLHRLDIPSVPVIHNATICANRQWVLENGETVLAFLRSMVEAIYFFKTQKSKSCEILERIVAPLRRLEGPAEVEYLWQGWANLLSAKPYPHPLAVWNVYSLDVAHDPNTNFIGPFELWDTSYLRDIDDSGFIDQLYGGPEKAVNPAVNAAI